LRLNIHTCSGSKTDGNDKQKEKTTNKNKNKKKKEKNTAPACRSNKYGTCKARCPRDIVSETMIDPETGALLMNSG
jgi:hypothetical protein